MNALRMFYLAAYLGLGAVLPLLALAMQARGLRPTQYGYLLALLPLSRLLAPPLWGALADKWLGTAPLLRVNAVLSAAALFVLTRVTGFVPTCISFAVFAFFSSSLVPLAEAGTYALLGARATRFGYIRVFGSIGFAISAGAVAVLGVDEAVRMPFVLAAAAYLAAAVVALFLSGARPTTSPSLWPAMRTLGARPDIVLLWLASTVYYVAHGAYDSYFGPHVKSLGHAGASTVSMSWAISVTCEVVMLFAMPTLLSRFSSHALLICASLVSVVRWLLLARATTALEVYALAPLHAVTFGVWYLAFVHANQQGAPESLRATVQGFSAACLGLGMILATVFGSYVLERSGGSVVFELAAVAAALSALLYGARAWVESRAAKQLAAPPSRA